MYNVLYYMVLGACFISDHEILLATFSGLQRRPLHVFYCIHNPNSWPRAALQTLLFCMAFAAPMERDLNPPVNEIAYRPAFGEEAK